MPRSLRARTAPIRRAARGRGGGADAGVLPSQVRATAGSTLSGIATRRESRVPSELLEGPQSGTESPREAA